MARGKKKPPSNPAPVSGPGALSRRTDGGPTDVPTYASATGERPYGERKAVEQQAAGAPMERDTSWDRVANEGVFGPSVRPGEPVTSGAPVGPGRTPEPMVSEDPDMLLRAVIEKFGPHPDLIRLLSRRA